MLYTLWNLETNTLLGEYENRHEALAVVLQGVKRDGRSDSGSLALNCEDDEGRVTTIARGQELAELAQREGDPRRAAM